MLFQNISLTNQKLRIYMAQEPVGRISDISQKTLRACRRSLLHPIQLYKVIFQTASLCYEVIKLKSFLFVRRLHESRHSPRDRSQ